MDVRIDMRCEDEPRGLEADGVFLVLSGELLLAMMYPSECSVKKTCNGWQVDLTDVEVAYRPYREVSEENLPGIIETEEVETVLVGTVPKDGDDGFDWDEAGLASRVAFLVDGSEIASHSPCKLRIHEMG